MGTTLWKVAIDLTPKRSYRVRTVVRDEDGHPHYHFTVAEPGQAVDEIVAEHWDRSINDWKVKKFSTPDAGNVKG